MNTFTAQTIRGITSEGAIPTSNQSNDMSSSFNSGSLHHLYSPFPYGIDGTSPTRHISLTSSLDGMMASAPHGVDRNAIDPVLSSIRIHNINSKIEMLNAQQERLSLLTDVGRRYPGYPSPLSPTFNAKQLFPSPASETRDNINIPLHQSPELLPASPMSIDSPGTDSSSRHCMPCADNYYVAKFGFNFYDPTANIIQSRLAFIPEAKIISNSPTYLRSPFCSPPSTSLPTLPNLPRVILPQSVTLKNLIEIQAVQSLSHRPFRLPPLPTSRISNSSLPAISIANGFETSTVSPISASGTMLSYMSNRSVDNGLLAVQPLSEAQVAEYRFWRPCERRNCAFGCGGSCEGEVAAAKRLFKEASEVADEEN